MTGKETKSDDPNTPSRKTTSDNPAPIQQSSEQEGMAPTVLEKDLVTPIGKSGVRISRNDRGKPRAKE
ncbi:MULTISPECIES: hypothetical protein [unclassified Rhizobium]|jgi:hypothetical protein|uniref:hypothetical protein n=1 Tax=unclassified Rhizobium TaxID=2613769 RepID=UPI000DD4C690|nr:MULTISPECIES: hypothetical protein [unclassified Rhizobium]MDK4715334.1 hypothetical protein [Rhizobium sp. CNPSo 4039]